MSHELMQLIAGTVSLLALLGGGIWWCMRRHLRHLWGKIRAAEKKRARTQNRFNHARVRFGKNQALISVHKERIKNLEKQFEEAIAEKEKLRNEGGQLDSQIRRIKSLANQLNRAKLSLEQQLKNSETECQTQVRISQDREKEVASLKREIAEARKSGGMDPEIVDLLQKKDEELSRLRKDKWTLEEQISKNGASLATRDQANREQEEKIESLNDQFDELTRQYQEQGKKLDEKVRALEEAQQKGNSLQKQMEDFKEEYQTLSKMAVEESGRIWERPARSGSPQFIPLSARSMPIISIINLKGGVGKTTLTANLAAILGQQGKRVLVIDLDFQRSLSRLCFSNEKIKAIHEEKRTLQHFLLDPHADAARLLRCTSPLGHADGCDIVINAEALQVKDASDSLEDAEMHLQAEWLMNPKGADVRFLLRKALHAPAVRERYNFVLLDCPPRLSTACINALAASDFALIPVMLDKLSAVSAPNLLRKLNQLRFNKILAPLNILGIVANRVEFYSAKPIKSQAAEWDELIVPCREAWGQAEHFFDTKIKQSSAFARAAERQTFAAFTDEFKPVFSDLLDELEARITHESSRAATVSA